MPLRVSAQGPDQQPRDQQQRQPAAEAVRKLDQQLGPRRARDHLAVAEWPVGAAASPRSSRADIRAPQDHQQIVAQDPPGIGRKAVQPHWYSTYFSAKRPEMLSFSPDSARWRSSAIITSTFSS